MRKRRLPHCSGSNYRYFEVFEKHIPFIRRSNVTIEFGEPFYAKELPLEERKHAGAYTRNKIIEMLKAEQEIRRSGK